jgi:hypothetical protein
MVAPAGRSSQRVGGKTIWRGRMEAMVTGPSDERWDAAFIAYHPSAGRSSRW